MSELHPDITSKGDTSERSQVISPSSQELSSSIWQEMRASTGQLDAQPKRFSLADNNSTTSSGDAPFSIRSGVSRGAESLPTVEFFDSATPTGSKTEGAREPADGNHGAHGNGREQNKVDSSTLGMGPAAGRGDSLGSAYGAEAVGASVPEHSGGLSAGRHSDDALMGGLPPRASADYKELASLGSSSSSGAGSVTTVTK